MNSDTIKDLEDWNNEEGPGGWQSDALAQLIGEARERDEAARVGAALALVLSPLGGSASVGVWPGTTGDVAVDVVWRGRAISGNGATLADALEALAARLQENGK